MLLAEHLAEFHARLAWILSTDKADIQTPESYNYHEWGVHLRYKPTRGVVVLVGTCRACGLGNLESLPIVDGQTYIAMRYGFEADESHRGSCRWRQREQRKQAEAEARHQREQVKARQGQMDLF